MNPVSLSPPGHQQALVPAGRYPDSRRLPGEAAVREPALRPAAQPALPPSVAGQWSLVARGDASLPLAPRKTDPTCVTSKDQKALKC